MSVVPSILISREREEELMAECDNSCASGPKCACIVDFGMTKSGKVVDGCYTCVLCCRKETTLTFNECMFHGTVESGRGIIFNPYSNMENDYPNQYYLDRLDPNTFRGVSGLFVAYNPGHYKVNPEGNGIVQCIPHTTTLNWFNKIFKMDVNLGPINGGNHIVERPWAIAVCCNPKCKINILSFINKPFAEGYDNTVFDMAAQRLCCIKCKTPVTKIESERVTRGVTCLGRHLFLNHDDHWFSRCTFCRTVVEFNKLKSPQSCDYCHKLYIEQALESTRVCAYCSNPVGLSRRGGAQTIQVDDKTMYLCRQHRIKGPTRTYTSEEFKLLME